MRGLWFVPQGQLRPHLLANLPRAKRCVSTRTPKLDTTLKEASEGIDWGKVAPFEPYGKTDSSTKKLVLPNTNAHEDLPPVSNVYRSTSPYEHAWHGQFDPFHGHNEQGSTKPRKKNECTPVELQFKTVRDTIHKELLLLFQVGDFFELYGPDADRVADRLNLRVARKQARCPAMSRMAGFPIHAADEWIETLTAAGFSFAICEQTSAPTTKGDRIFRREVTRIVTPGTRISGLYHDANYLLAIGSPVVDEHEGPVRSSLGLAWIDLSSAHLETAIVPESSLEEELERLQPSEVLVDPLAWVDSSMADSDASTGTSDTGLRSIVGSMVQDVETNTAVNNHPFATGGGAPEPHRGSLDSSESARHLLARKWRVSGIFVDWCRSNKFQGAMEMALKEAEDLKEWKRALGAVNTSQIEALKGLIGYISVCQRGKMYSDVGLDQPSLKSFHSKSVQDKLNAEHSYRSLDDLHTASSLVIGAMSPQVYNRSSHMAIDAETRNALEIAKPELGRGPFRGPGSLLHAVDGSSTAMGRRLLSRRVCAPSTDIAEISRRHNGVEFFSDRPVFRTEVNRPLRNIGDIDRLMQRIDAGNGQQWGPLLDFRDSLRGLLELHDIFDKSQDGSLTTMSALFQEKADVDIDVLRDVKALHVVLCEALPASSPEGSGGGSMAGHVSEEFSPDLQSLRRSQTGFQDLRGKLLAYYCALLGDRLTAPEAQKAVSIKTDRRSKLMVLEVRTEYVDLLLARSAGLAVEKVLDEDSLTENHHPAAIKASHNSVGSDFFRANQAVTGYLDELVAETTSNSMNSSVSTRAGKLLCVSERARQDLLSWAKTNSVAGSELLKDPNTLRLRHAVDGRVTRTGRTTRLTSTALLSLQTHINQLQTDEDDILQSIYNSLRQQIRLHRNLVTKASSVIAEIDFATTAARLAREEGWTRPEISPATRNGGSDRPLMVIEDGKHAVLSLDKSIGFQGNDTRLGEGSPEMDLPPQDMVLITGPNMGGKSTYLRQNALIAILGQAGLFVPAARVSFTMVDRLFARVGASDNLRRSESTFMVEMRETAQILRHATRDSLVLIDELGRGTSWADGLCLAIAVLERLRDDIQCRTFVATHFHELYDSLASTLSSARQTNSVQALQVHCDVVSFGSDDVRSTPVFHHKLRPGIASNSFGIHIAEMAGVPRHVIERAHALAATCTPGQFGGNVHRDSMHQTR
eukprot:Clim_evm5s57 gene=Clim_evmTU5s57